MSLGLAGNEDTHPPLCFMRHRPAEIFVDPPNCANGFATNLVILNVADAIVFQTIAFTQKLLHRFIPVIDSLTAHDEGIDAAIVGDVTDPSEGRVVVDADGERALEHPGLDPFWGAFGAWASEAAAGG